MIDALLIASILLLPIALAWFGPSGDCGCCADCCEDSPISVRFTIAGATSNEFACDECDDGFTATIPTTSDCVFSGEIAFPCGTADVTLTLDDGSITFVIDDGSGTATFTGSYTTPADCCEDLEGEMLSYDSETGSPKCDYSLATVTLDAVVCPAVGECLNCADPGGTGNVTPSKMQVTLNGGGNTTNGDCNCVSLEDTVYVLDHDEFCVWKYEDLDFCSAGGSTGLTVKATLFAVGTPADYQWVVEVRFDCSSGSTIFTFSAASTENKPDCTVVDMTIAADSGNTHTCCRVNQFTDFGLDLVSADLQAL